MKDSEVALLLAMVESIKKDILGIRRDINELNKFRWQTIGLAIGISSVVSVFGTILIRGI